MSHTETHPTPGEEQRADELFSRFVRALAASPTPPLLEVYLQEVSPAQRAALLERLLTIELRWRRSIGEQPKLEDYRPRFPQEQEVLERLFHIPSPLPEEDLTAITRPMDAESSLHIPGGVSDIVCPEGDIVPTRPLDPDNMPSVPARHAWWPTIPGYEIVGELGQGGMGVVYKARQLDLNRLVALKMVAGTTHTKVQLRRFQAEAEAIARLQHPAIVQIFAVGEHRGQPYFALELVEGGTLRARIDRRPLPREDAVRLIETIAHGIHHAHKNGIIHRDLKPGNILLTTEGEPKVTDFGVAKLLDSEYDRTRTGAVLGTAEYMSPEQAAGKTRQVGPGADIYSLGVILFECLTGRRPIEGDGQMKTLELVLLREPDSLRRWMPDLTSDGAGGDLDAICQKCLEKEPHLRYPSAEALADDLARWRNREPVVARPIGRFGRLWRWCRRKPMTAALVLVSALLVLTVTIATPVLYFLLRETEALRQIAERAEEEERKRTIEARRQEAIEREQKVQASRRVARLHAITGIRFLEIGDYFRALVWTTDALIREEALDASETTRDALRLRVTALLNECPRLLHTAQVPIWTERVWLSADGKELHGLDKDRHRFGRWRLSDGASVSPGFTPSPTARATLFSEEGRLVLTQDTEGVLQVWETETGNLVQELNALPKEMRTETLRFWTCDPARRRLFAVFDGPKKALGFLWSLENGKRLHETPEEFAFWNQRCSAQMSTTTKRLLVITPDRTTVLDADSGLPKTSQMPKMAVATLSPGGTLVAGSQGGRTPLLWDIKSDAARPWPATSTQNGPITRLRLDPGGTRLLLISNDTRARLWSARTGEPLGDWLSHPGVVRDGWFSPDERHLATISDEGTIHVWDLFNEQNSMPLRHSSPVTFASWSAEGRQLVTRGRDGSVCVWDLTRLASSSVLMPHEGPVQGIAFSRDGARVLTACDDGLARVWDVRTAKELGTALRHAGPVVAAEWGQEDQRIVTVSERTARVWDIAKREPLTPPFGTEGGVAFAVQRPSSDHVLYGTGGRVVLHDPKANREVFTIRQEGEVPIRTTAFSPGGQMLATAATDGSIQVWDCSTRKQFHQIKIEGTPTTMTFLTENDLAITGTDGLSVWNRKSKKRILQVPESSSETRETFRSAHLDPEGKWLITVSPDNACQVWEVASGRAGGPRFQPGGALRLAAVTTGGRRVVTVLQEGVVQLWDTNTGDPLTPAIRLGGFIHDARLGPDGKLLALACREGKALFWKVPSEDSRSAEDLHRLACLLAAREIDGQSGALTAITSTDSRERAEATTRTLPDEISIKREAIRNWHQYQARVCEQAKRWRAALLHLAVLRRAEPEECDLLERIVKIQFAINNPEGTLEDLSALIRLRPHDIRHYVQRARALMQLERWEEASEDVKAALGLDPDNTSIIIRHSLLLGRLGKDRLAREAWRKGLHLVLGRSYEVVFESALRRDPQDIYRIRKQWQPLRDDLTTFIDDFKSSLDADGKWRPVVHRHRALAHAALGDWSAVEKDIESDLHWGKKNSESFRLRALAFVVNRKEEKALEEVGKAIALDPDDPSLHMLQERIKKMLDKRP